jgi:ABC-type multidrug transport system ATPase subunit
VELVAGYLRPWSGLVLVNGILANCAEARPGRAVARSVPALYSNMTVFDHLAFAARARPDSRGQGELMTRAEKFGLFPWMDCAADQLSTGNRRKLWIIMTTAGTPRVVVLDEPFDGLDSATVDILIGEIKAWSDDRMVILVAHQLPAALRCDVTLSLPEGSVTRWAAPHGDSPPQGQSSEPEKNGNFVRFSHA